MAEICLINEDEFRRELIKMEESVLVAQAIMQHGSLHALRYLQRKGVTAENCDKMIEQLERNCGVVDQVAAERGIDLPITHEEPPCPR